jgi:hypothetical protein
MMKKFLLVSALMCAIVGVAASMAVAGNPVVAGAGFSPNLGHIVLNARATEPMVGSGSQDLAATGFLRARNVPTSTGSADLSGTVTCIGVWLPGFAVAVSGTLNTPDRATFSLLIWRAFGDKPWLAFFPGVPIPGPAAGTCGIQLFFLAGLETTFELPAYHLTTGNLVINGTT